MYIAYHIPEVCTMLYSISASDELSSTYDDVIVSQGGCETRSRTVHGLIQVGVVESRHIMIY